MRTIAVVARKGGSGKTTLAVHLALAAHLSGRRTVLVDMDPQRSAIEALRMRQGGGPRRRPGASTTHRSWPSAPGRRR